MYMGLDVAWAAHFLFKLLPLTICVQANKRQIKQAVKGMYEITCQKVNTLIRPDGSKKAFIRLTQDIDALEVANRVGII